MVHNAAENFSPAVTTRGRNLFPSMDIRGDSGADRRHNGACENVSGSRPRARSEKHVPAKAGMDTTFRRNRALNKDSRAG